MGAAAAADYFRECSPGSAQLSRISRKRVMKFFISAVNSSTMSKEQLPFLFGAQYYRAPTPERECWATDLAKMKDLGFTQVKYWVQWRWAHRAQDRFYWDDLDELMDLAAKNGIGVTLNTIMDVSPIWLFERYPDAKQIDIKGLVVGPFAIQHRQIGGQPGPCYNHAGAQGERKKFMQAAV